MMTMLTTERIDANTMLELNILTPIVSISQAWVPGKAMTEIKLSARAQSASSI